MFIAASFLMAWLPGAWDVSGIDCKCTQGNFGIVVMVVQLHTFIKTQQNEYLK